MLHVLTDPARAFSAVINIALHKCRDYNLVLLDIDLVVLVLSEVYELYCDFQAANLKHEESALGSDLSMEISIMCVTLQTSTAKKMVRVRDSVTARKKWNQGEMKSHKTCCENIDENS